MLCLINQWIKNDRALNRRAENEERRGVEEVHDNEAKIIVGGPSLSISPFTHTIKDHNGISKSRTWYYHRYNRQTAAKNPLSFVGSDESVAALIRMYVNLTGIDILSVHGTHRLKKWAW